MDGPNWLPVQGTRLAPWGDIYSSDNVISSNLKMASSKAPGADSEGVCWTWTHFTHQSSFTKEDCINFPREVCTLHTAHKKQFQIVCGGSGVETCPSTGKQHRQGWLMLDQPIRFKQLKSMFCDTIHWEKMHGTLEENMDYCKKEDMYVGFGDYEGKENPHLRKGKGARNDLADVEMAVREGTSLKRLFEDHFSTMVKFHRGIEKAKKVLAKPWVEAPRQFIVMWGEAGAGKSWKTQQLVGDDTFFIPDQNNSGLLSFENYDGQKWILLEDFESKSLPVTVLKRMTDRYEMTLPGRGTSVMGAHSGVILTTNYNPEEWYTSKEDYLALLRRMTGNLYCTRRGWKDLLTGEELPNPCPHVKEVSVPNFNPNFLL